MFNNHLAAFNNTNNIRNVTILSVFFYVIVFFRYSMSVPTLQMELREFHV